MGKRWAKRVPWWSGAGALVLAGAVQAASLTIGDDVTVVFDGDAGLLVRDQLTVGARALLTGSRDPAAGVLSDAPQVAPAAGDWAGVTIHKSASAAGLSFGEASAIRYAGTGLRLIGYAPTLKFLRLTGNGVGMQLDGAVNPSLVGLNFVGNGIGLETLGGAQATVSQSLFRQSTSYGIANRMPEKVVTATGNWWGDASGPRDLAGNPEGTGDAVTAGVNYGQWLAGTPLVNPSVKAVYSGSYVDQAAVAIELACLNATHYRLAETPEFSGVVFRPFESHTTYTLSAGDGLKPLYAQFRDDTGSQVTVSVAGGIRLDTEVPQLTIATPANSSLVDGTVVVEATASDAAGIAKVQIYLNDVLKATLTGSGPYRYSWDTTPYADGGYIVKAVATDNAGRTSTQTAGVTVAHAPPPPDLEGPTTVNLRLASLGLIDGATLATGGLLSVDASDRSGVSRVEFFLDGVRWATDTTASGSSYQAQLDLDDVPNGAHQLTIQAYDSLNQVTTLTLAFTLQHALPTVPVLSQPSQNLVTRQTELAVAGNAQAGRSVQLLVNGVPQGAVLTADSKGAFFGSVTLSHGVSLISATASDAYGTSAPGTAIKVTVDTSVPMAPSGLSAGAQSAGKVRLTWTRASDPSIVAYEVYRANAPFAGIGEALRVARLAATAAAYDDLPLADNIYYYRVVAVNAVGTASAPTNPAQAVSDATLPKAVSVQYTSSGKVDAASGRLGQGRVAVVLTVSEPLAAVPYLSVVPAGSAPLPIDLVAQDETHYAGSFVIDQNTGTGLANVLFSARDRVGNRGTAIDSGASLQIDASGPVVTGIALTPAAPIRADAGREVGVRLSFDQALQGAPTVSVQLSGAIRTPAPVGTLTAVDASTWQGQFTLPADAGLAATEFLSFAVSAQDDLDNVSSKITAGNRFEVYQGELPPLASPLDFTAVAQPGGKVQLSWSAVDQASGYQLYRQGPGEAGLSAYQRVDGLAYVDATSVDGAYTYTLAAIRSANGQEAQSAQSAPQQVQASATAPGAPQNLALTLTSLGIRATWQPPIGGSTPASYRLYRAASSSITSVAGLTPLKSGLKTTEAIDAAPSPTAHAYVVTAVDAAGNESALSNSAYLNASLLPVKVLQVEQIDAGQPVVSWTPNGSGAVGFNVYVGADSALTKLNDALLTGQQLSDTGYAGGERRYTVEAVDSNDTRIARSLSLPAVASEIVGGLPLRRGVMNKVLVQVANLGASPLARVTLVVKAGGISHRSAEFALAASETRLVPVIVGGYHDLPNPAALQLSLESVPHEGELARITRSLSAEVTDSLLVFALAPENFVRGSSGTVRFTVENTSEVEVELLTARNGGKDASNEVRFKLLDGDGNVLGVQAFKQTLGTGVVTLANGQTVARLAPGASYTSAPLTLAVPGSSPDQLTVRLEVDQLRYHSGQLDQIAVRGTGTEQRVSLAETAYYGEVTRIAPLSSFGDEEVVIEGQAVDRASGAPLANANLKLILNQQGFERALVVLTDGGGQFAYRFKPTATDAGLYKVAALHPDMTDRPVHGQFVINRVTVTPDIANVSMPRNYAARIDARAQAGAGTQASNLRLVYDAQYQPAGVAPAGLQVSLPAPVNLSAGQSLALPVLVTGDNTAAPSGSLVIKAFTDEHGSAPLDSLTVNYTLVNAPQTTPLPVLYFSPNLISTGMAQGGSELESLVLENKGYAPMNDVVLALTNPDGSQAPEWVTLASEANLGSLAVGEKRSVDLRFAPGSGVTEGNYEFRLQIRSSSLPTKLVNVYAAVTQSGQGGVLFKASDIYTATRDAQGNLIEGLGGARITLQNELVSSVVYTLTTDNLGEALFATIPAGSYRFKASASNHQEMGGRLTVKPGVTQTQAIFLEYNLVTVEWSVREVTIQDRYEITLQATYETDVPAPVVMLEPASVNLPLMKAGEVYYGEFTLTNYGLTRADNVRQKLPASDAFFRYEFLTAFPEQLAAKQRVTIPYRVVALQSLDQPAGTASGGGCYSYSNYTAATCSYVCANGTESTACGSRASWFANSSSTCPTSSGTTSTPVVSYSSSWGGGGGGGGSGNGTTSGTLSQSFTPMPGLPACVKCDGSETKPPCATCGAQ